MKRIIVLFFIVVAGVVHGQKVLRENAIRTSVSDTSVADAQSGAIAWYGHSMIAGFGLGNVSDSNIVNVYKEISGYYGYNMGVSGETSTQIMTRFINSPSDFTKPLVFWLTRNSPDSTTDINNMKRIRDTLTKYKNDRYLIIDALNRRDETSGTAGFNTIISINNGYYSNFPGHVIHLRRFIIDSRNVSIPADVTAYNDSVPPPSLMNDLIHMNGAGYRLAAIKIYNDWSQIFSGDKIMNEISWREFFKAPRLNTDNNNLLVGSKVNLQNGNIGLSSTSITHPLTIGNPVGNKGIRMFNTTDETTNTERVDISYNGTYFQISSTQTGTGTARPMRFGMTGGINFDVGAVISGLQKGAVSFNATLFGGNSSIGGVYGSLGSFQNNNGFAIVPDVNKADGVVPGSAQMLWISPWKQSTSGPLGKNMIRVGWNSATRGTGTDTAYWILDSTGNILGNGGAFFGADKVVGMTANPVRDASAFVQMNSTTSGLLIPRMTATQRGAISSPATGLVVYQTDGTSGFYFYNGSTWGIMGSNAYTFSGGNTNTGGTVTNDLITPTAGSKTITGGTASNNTLSIVGNNNSGSTANLAAIALKSSGASPATSFEVMNNGVSRSRAEAKWIFTFSSSKTADESDAAGRYHFNGTTATLTLPTAPAISGWTFVVKNVGSGILTIGVSGGGSLLFDTSLVSSLALTVGASRRITWDGTLGYYVID